MDASSASVKVLSVVGAGRSGTTVLASVLGEIDGFVSAGEVRWLWDRGVRGRRPCGCGEPPEDCPVWAPVVAKTLAGLGAGDRGATVDDVVAAQREVSRRRSYRRVLRGLDGSDGGWPAMGLVRDVTGTACTTLAEVTGSHVVVDTSKRPVDAAVLAGVPQVDHYVLHIVRDPRAVVHSWRRAKTFTAAGETRTMGTRSLASTVRRWTGNSLWAEALRRRVPGTRWMHIRYEDLAAAPRAAIEEIVSFLGETGAAPFVDERTVLLGANHIVAGNPSRFTTGEVSIRNDDAWERQMPARDQRLVELMALPLMLRHGYRPRGRRQVT